MSNSKRKLTNLDYADPEYWHDEPTTAITPTKRGELVRPLPQPAPVVARRMEPVDIHIDTPQQSLMNVVMRTSAVDRAQGFTIETHQLSVVAGLFAVLIAVFGQGHPFLTLGTLFTFGLWYTIVWFAAWLIHRVISPEGIAMFNAIIGAILALRRN